MPLIEQAVLLVRATGNRWTAKVIEATEDLCSSDFREVVDWFSGDRKERVLSFETPSLFFHPLPSGHFALGKIVPRRGTLASVLKPGGSFYVHVLAVAAETLLQFANNPFALSREVEYQNGWLPLNCRPKSLRPLRIELGGRLFDKNLLRKTIERYSPETLAVLLQSCFDSLCTFLTGSESTDDVIETILSLLPVSWRTDLSFSTELHFPSQHPFKLVGVPVSMPDFGIPMFDLDAMTRSRVESGLVLDPWPLFVCHMLKQQAFELFEHCLTDELLFHPETDPSESIPNDPESLSEMGSDWLDRLYGRRRPVPDPFSIVISGNHPTPKSHFGEPPNVLPLDSHEPDRAVFYRTDSEKEASPPPACTTPKSSGLPVLKWTNGRPGDRAFRYPHLQEDLASIDSYTSRALFGDETAVELLRNEWKSLANTLSWYDRSEIQAEYVELIQAVILHGGTFDANKTPQRTLDALDVLEVFLH